MIVKNELSETTSQWLLGVRNEIGRTARHIKAWSMVHRSPTPRKTSASPSFFSQILRYLRCTACHSFKLLFGRPLWPSHLWIHLSSEIRWVITLGYPRGYRTYHLPSARLYTQPMFPSFDVQSRKPQEVCDVFIPSNQLLDIVLPGVCCPQLPR